MHGVLEVDGPIEVPVHDVAGDAAVILPDDVSWSEADAERGDGNVRGRVVLAEDGDVQRGIGLCREHSL